MSKADEAAVEYAKSRFDATPEEVPGLAEDYRAGFDEGLRVAAGMAAQFVAHYPTDIFVPLDPARNRGANALLASNGFTRDAISADVIRSMAPAIARLILKEVSAC